MESHPLEHEWVLWVEGGGKSEKVSVTTVAEFWTMMKAMKPVSKLPDKVDYCLFKKGIEPKWEDPHNANGGTWEMCFKKKSPACRKVDMVWKSVLVGNDPERDLYTVFIPQK